MFCGPVAPITEEHVNLIKIRASEEILKEYDIVPDDLRLMAKLCVAATGGHVAVDDRFFFHCMNQVVDLRGKALARWKDKVDDGKGTHRRVYWGDGMLRVKDDSHTAVPLIPMTIALKVNRSSAKDLLDRVIPHVVKRRFEQRVLQARPLPPVTASPPSRNKTRSPGSLGSLSGLSGLSGLSTK